MVEEIPTQKVEWLGAQHRWKIAAAGILTVIVMALFVLLKPSAPRGLENGSFVNDCCGSLTLLDGEMILNDKLATSYTVGRDARGFYVLPSSYVGGMDNIGFEIDGSRPASKLRLDRMPNPKILLVHGGRETFVFKRGTPNDL